jgi:ATP-dependent helicase/nuclease subunit A
MTDSADLFAFRTNIVVTASAGTGKTFRLVTLYALLTLGLTSKGERDDDQAAPPVAAARIAATTFSRAAAAEIRERVERLLRAVAAGSSEPAMAPYFAVLDERARRTGSPEVSSTVMRERARRALEDLPHALIDTLHGLAGRIVRACALDLGLSPSYGVLDEDAARVSVDAATEAALSDALSRGNRAAFHLLDAAGGLAMARLRIAELLDRADEEGVRVGDLACADFVEAATASMARLRDVCDRLVSEQSRTMGEPARAARDAAADWLQRGAGERAPRALERELTLAFTPLFERRSPARPLASEADFVAYRESVRGETNAARARRLAAFVGAAPELAPRALGMRALLAEIGERRSAERRRSGMLGFGDLLRSARDALRDDPRVASMARAMFDVLLVDEFQDTSGVQRDLVYLLRESPACAERRPNGTLPRAKDLESSGLLVVGDRKQSIYGFRGADVTVFARVSLDLAGRPASEALRLGSDFDVPETPNAALVTLHENRRSHPRILDFVNEFAAQDFDDTAPYPFDIRYAESERLAPPGDRPHEIDGRGASRIVVVDDPNETSDGFEPLVRGASPPLREALIAASIIDRAVREKPFGPFGFADIAVLARRRATLPLLEMALARLDVPYVVAGRGLFETREVRDVFAVLRLMLDPYDRHALATVLRGPAVGLSDRALALLSDPGRGLVPPRAWFGEKTKAADVLPADERDHLRDFARRLDDLWRVGLDLTPASAIRYATEKLDLDRVVAALPHAAQRLGNVERLVAIANERGGTLPSFVRWLDQQIADQTDESEAAAMHETTDAVTLMTIHASKGLEFRAVVLVDMGAAVRATPMSLALVPPRQGRAARLAMRHVHDRGGSLHTPEAVELAKENTAREIAERRRLTYVAMTRAKELLFLLVPPAPANGSAGATMRRALPVLAALPGVAVESATPYLEKPARAPTLPEVPGDEPLERPSGVVHRLPIAVSTTPLATFAECQRRYRLVHELAVDPPPWSGASRADVPGTRDAHRAVGTAAHRMLERWPLSSWGNVTRREDVVAALCREGVTLADPVLVDRVSRGIAAFVAGPYAARVRDARTVLREERFVVPIEGEGGALVLHGTVDLLVGWADGSWDIIDYKSSFREEPASYDFQLRAYAVAARHRYGARSVRVGVLHFARDPEPRLAELDEDELRSFERSLVALRDRFARARTSGHFPGAPLSTCEELRCGFVAACHGA